MHPGGITAWIYWLKQYYELVQCSTSLRRHQARVGQWDVKQYHRNDIIRMSEG